MSRNIVPRVDKGADLGTQLKNWNKLYVDAVILKGENLQTILNSKASLNTLMAKGDLYVATGPGVVTRLPRGADGYFLATNSTKPEGLEWRPADIELPLTESIEVTVGDGGNFGTINQALSSITSLYIPKYLLGGGVPRVTIRLLPGFVMNEQVLVESLDLSWITIVGDDIETIINRSALITSISINDQLHYPAFAAINGGFLPIIGQLFNMNTTGSDARKHAIMAYNNSRAIVAPNCGARNVSGYSIYADRNSSICANNAIASESVYGIYANYCSTISAVNANASNATYYGVRANNCSTISASGINASGSSNTGIEASRGSTINAENADAHGAVVYAISANDCSAINAYNANASESGYGVYVITSSIVQAKNINASGAVNNGIFAAQNSTVNAFYADASGSGDSGITIQSGSIVDAHGAIGTLVQDKNILTSRGIIFQEE